MGLLSSSSKKSTQNVNKSQAGQSSYGDVNNYNAEAGATLTVTDAGAIAAGAKANDNATALAAEALRTNTNVLMATGEYVGNMLANESSENRQFVSEAHETNALLLGEMSKNNAALSGAAMDAVNTANRDALNANQQMANNALSMSGAAMDAMSVFANESLERVSDTNESALTQTNDAFKTSIQQLAANQAASQNQINDLLTNLQTEGESEVQKTSGKQTVWIVGIAGVAVLAVALLARK
ncbi:hypothetical protein [Terasakiella pusilla]|uniref:hypothetical protein n=1 Tax=Terasakiella pusilla TaxID=64973 RepID=UPI003AA989B8